MRYAIGSSPDIRLADVSGAPSLIAVTLVVWQIQATPAPRLVGAVEVQVTTADRAVHSEIIRAEEPIAADLPGDPSRPPADCWGTSPQTASRESCARACDLAGPNHRPAFVVTGTALHEAL